MLWENKRRNGTQAKAGFTYDDHEGQRLSLLDKTEFVSGRQCISLGLDDRHDTPIGESTFPLLIGR